jgi:putative transposase
VTFAFIEAHQAQWPVRVMCDALEVSPSGFYSWLSRPPSLQEERREALAGKIREIHAEVKGRYGSPRVHAALDGADGARSVNTVAKIMRDNDIRSKTARKFRCRTTDSNHALPVADNVLDRQFDPSGPNRRGWRTSPTSPPVRAGCTWPSWRTSSPG